jgi:hypothetical protein
VAWHPHTHTPFVCYFARWSPKSALPNRFKKTRIISITTLEIEATSGDDVQEREEGKCIKIPVLFLKYNTPTEKRIVCNRL